MKGIEMYYTVKTLLDQGWSISGIARELGIDRKTVRKIRERVKDGAVKVPRMRKRSRLDSYREEILSYLEEGLSGVLIHRKLCDIHGVEISYSGLKKYLRKLKVGKDGKIPILSPPGKEAQVDFGYAGKFLIEGKWHKCWVFCMTLSYSRMSYYELVLRQDIETFLRCHINAFEYFGGVPEVVLIDNLKSGVVRSNFYEPEIQSEYSRMLQHYGSSPVTCRVRRPEEKGKVESGIKYVKRSFLKGLDSRELSGARTELKRWLDEVCNSRVHGTTRKVPREEFERTEKRALKPLPLRRYEVPFLSKRKVNAYSHVYYKYNYYSVPYRYVGKEVSLKATSHLLHIFDKDLSEIAVHIISNGKGEFITNKSHIPDYKLPKPRSYYEAKCKEIGPFVLDFLNHLEKAFPQSWRRSIQGVLSLGQSFEPDVLNKACERAIVFGAISYRSVKRICENGLYASSDTRGSTVTGSGFANDLSIYDRLAGGEGPWK